MVNKYYLKLKSTVQYQVSRIHFKKAELMFEFRIKIDELVYLSTYPFVQFKKAYVRWLWHKGYLKGNQTSFNNEFLLVFSQLTSEDKISLLRDFSTTKIIQAFSASTDDHLKLLFQHCSTRAADMLLTDILLARYYQSISFQELMTAQLSLLRAINSQSFCDKS